MFVPRRPANVSARTATRSPIARRYPCRPAYLSHLRRRIVAPRCARRHQASAPLIWCSECWFWRRS